MRNITYIAGNHNPAEVHPWRFRTIMSNVANWIATTFWMRKFKTFEDVQTEWKTLDSIIHRLLEQEAETDPITARRATEATGIVVKPLEIRWDIFIKRQESCFEVYDRILKIHKILIKKFNKQIKSHPATVDSILAEDSFSVAMRNVNSIISSDIEFKLVDSMEWVRWIKNPQKLIHSFKEIEQIMESLFHDDSFMRVMQILETHIM